jgi:2-methylcitrate dehydratase PrpD
VNFSEVIAWAFDGPPDGGAAAAKARLLLLDSLGCALAGLGHARVQGFARAMGGTVAPVLATATCWDEANEGLARAHGRPALPVAPLALVARAKGAAPRRALAAFAIGYEVAARAGEIWRIRPGMHVDGSWHSLGAAACAARLLDLDADGVARAVRIAACQIPFSLYAPIAAGMDGRNTYPAHAVLLGQLAAAAAAAGMDAPEEGFGIARGLALGGPQARMTPPGRWLLEEAYIKPFAGVRHAHYAAAAALALRDRVPAMPGRIELATYAEALRYAGNRAPRAAIAAQFSLSWAVAAALAQGDLGPAAYTDAALADPRLRALEQRVILVEDTALTAAGRRGATLTVDGAAEAVTGVTGDPDRPMSEAEAIAKFGRFATPALGEAGVARAIAAILHDGPAEGLLP